MGRRTHPPAKLGDTFGTFTVIGLLPRGYKRRSDERVLARCSCGLETAAYVFNLRVAKSECMHYADGRLTAVGARLLRGAA